MKQHITQPSDLPESGELIIVISSSIIHHDGDERSRTNPGHGYSAYDEIVPVVNAFANEEDLKVWIERQRDGYPFKIIMGHILAAKKKVEYDFRPAK
jgi:hypothetical protein